MEIIKTEKKLCISCMEEHEVKTVRVIEHNVFKDEDVEYEAIYEYCDITDEYHALDDQISENDISMKNAYRKKVGILTTSDISSIRAKYEISQSDLALLLGWGAKTITRYESHHVQDIAHDTILKKLDNDPEWFISLLQEAQDKLSQDSYAKYCGRAAKLYEDAQDAYLRKSIYAQYARFDGNSNHCGGSHLNIDKVIDIVNYLANSTRVTSLYKVKLMKLLWYIDALSYKRRGCSMTGLVYTALQMGAVPIAHKSIIDLRGIEYTEVDIGDGTGYKFISTTNSTYATLTGEDRAIIDTIIGIFGQATKDAIVQRMHKEQAYVETAPNDVIQFKYAKELSIS